MRRLSFWKLAVVAALAAGAAVTGVALAAGGHGGTAGTVPLPGVLAGSHDTVNGAAGFGLRLRFLDDGFDLGVDSSAAASYLGLSTDELQAQLRSGKTLAQIAGAASGKSVDGLVDALLAAAKTKLDAAVTAGKLTADQEGTILSKLRSAVTDLVNGIGPKGGPGLGMGPGLGHGFGVGVDLSKAASYLGLSTDELMSQLRSGKTLAQIAGATSGKSVDGLVDALVAAAKTKLDAAVTAGKLTDDQEQTILSKLRPAIIDLVNAVGPVGPKGGRGFGFGIGGDLSTAASYLGLSTDELQAQLRSGKTLAQIVGATSGKSVDGLVDALVAAAKTKLDAAVAAGKLTSDEEQAMLAKLRSGITDLVNGVRPALPWGMRHGGPHVGARWSDGHSI